jgi:hypothetical protein
MLFPTRLGTSGSKLDHLRLQIGYPYFYRVLDRVLKDFSVFFLIWSKSASNLTVKNENFIQKKIGAILYN